MENKSRKQAVLMMTVVTGQGSKESGEYLRVGTADPVALYGSLKSQGLLNQGDFSGVSIDKTQKYRTVENVVVDDHGYWQEAGFHRGLSDDFKWEEAGWIGRRTHMEPTRVPDGFSEETIITASKRADIRQEKKALFLVWEAINEPALRKAYQKTLKTSPVAQVLTSLVGEEKSRNLTTAFDAVRSIKPPTVKEANDDRKVSQFQSAYAKAVARVKKEVKDSGVLGVLPQAQVQALVKRAVGMDI